MESALYHSKDLVIGNGPQGPFDHLFELKSPLYKMGSLQKFNPDDLFLYAVTDSGMNKKWGRSIKDAVKAAIEGGATIVQLRLSFLKTTKVPFVHSVSSFDFTDRPLNF